MTVHTVIVLNLAFFQLVLAAALLAIPYMTHRDLLFGVPVPPDFRSTEAGRKAMRSYRFWVGLPAAANLLALLLLPVSGFNLAAILLTAVIGLASFLAMNRRLKPFAIQPSLRRHAELGPADHLPGFVWLGVLPLLLLAGVAIYVHLHWSEIPLRFPVHYDINGAPNGWSDRSIRGVYGLLVFGGELALLLLGLEVAGWYGTRRSEPMRKPALVVMLAVEAAIAIAFGQIPLTSTGLVHVPLLLGLLGPMLFLIIPAILYAVRESNKPRDGIDPTPNECWKGGMIYYNPNDAALFVQRRDGLGLTVNFGNRWSWAIFAALLMVIGSGPLVMGVLPK